MNRTATVGLIAAFLACGIASADEMISLPEKVTVQPGRLVRVTAKSELGKTIRWVNPHPDLLDLIPSESGRWVILSATKPGTYRVYAYTAVGGEPTEPAVCVIIVGGPEPNPNPPTPGPNPPEPGPADPLTAVLQAAYATDPGTPAEKERHRDALAAFYRQAAAFDLASVSTAGQLRDLLAKARKVLLPDEALVGTRRAVAARQADLLPTEDDAALTQDHRANARVFFARVSRCLEAVR